MNKSKLQELCQKNSWRLPIYDSVKVGPDHRPHFTATVTVNDTTFDSSPVQCSSSKEAQNVAAQVALDHFASFTIAPKQPMSLVSRSEKHAYSGTSALTTNLDTKAAKSGEKEQNRQYSLPLAQISTSIGEGLLHTYKNQLQLYAQKRNLILPAYSCEVVGPPHARRYKSKVTVDGQSFETPNFFSTLKDAENGAAKVAFESMSLHLTQEGEVLYKSLLQEHAQRKRLHFPTYDTTRSGPSHMPIFVSTVVIGGQSYQGQEAKTKKMAEVNAAKAAYICLMECQKTQSSDSSIGEISNASSFKLQPDVTGKVKENISRKSSISIKEQAQEIQGVLCSASGQKTQSSNSFAEKTSDASSLNLQPDVTVKVKDVARKDSISIKEQAQEIQDNNGKRHRNSTTTEDAYARERGSSTAKSPPQDPTDIASLPTLSRVIPPAQTSIKRILVCPRTADMIIPEGAVILPSSDDRWVAMAMTVPEDEYEEYHN